MVHPDTITCPRCGYDLSGAQAAQPNADEPSAAGTCSECGLQFSWSEVTSGRLHTPRFSYEHGSCFNPIRFGRTFFRSTTVRLWEPLKMSHEIRPGHLAVFAVLSLFTLHLVTCAAVLFGARYGYLANWSPSIRNAYSAAYISSLSSGRPPPPAPTPASPVLFQSTWNGPVISDDLPPLLLWPYEHSPMFIFGSRSFNAALQIEPILASAATMLGPAALLLLLRQTRRQFRLRKLHVWRAVCLAMPMLLSTLVLTNLLVVVAARGGLSVSWIRTAALLPVLIGTLCYLTYHTLWWWAFTRRYLRAPHALGIAVAGVVIGGLCFVLAAIAFHSQLLYTVL